MKYTLKERINSIVIFIGKGLSWIYLIIVFLSVYEVFMRYVFNRPTIWVHETTLSLAAIVMLYGGIYTYAKNKHISVSVIVDMLPKKIQYIFSLLADIIALLYIILLLVSTIIITKFALFSPTGAIYLERSGSSWNSIFPSIIKLSMSLFLVLFVILVIAHIITKIQIFISSSYQQKTEE